MEMTEILNKNLMKTNMNAKSKDEVLHELAELLLANGNITDIEGFIKDIYAREAEGQTGIGNYVAIPHGKSAFVKDVGVAIGINNEEIPWETLDGKGVKGIILFAVGDDVEAAKDHLKLLAMFARKLGNDEVVANLLQAKDQNAIVTAFV
ncbi:fructose PTS transporter subunit IIA [Enterococcus sp. ALS3]|uniref:Fructose PTS transporter subunit IIA n=1 Tax=Enterococcus alishanensis TaxID=1303817 RepID=A0ABS6TFT7_9ENTE|nr:fructose PTS transporter subunit IIA [Enterococcus alishanensis]MBV7391817.1 fructose PTS transporter subunit IIA [Enterococcus alishanensis]